VHPSCCDCSYDFKEPFAATVPPVACTHMVLFHTMPVLCVANTQRKVVQKDETEGGNSLILFHKQPLFYSFLLASNFSLSSCNSRKTKSLLNPMTLSSVPSMRSKCSLVKGCSIMRPPAHDKMGSSKATN